MGKGGKESFIEFWQVQSREFTTAGETVFVDVTAVFMQEVAGDGVDNHHVVAGACFDIFFLQFGIRCVEVSGEGGYFFFGDIDHEVAAAVATYGAVYLWGNEGIQFPDKLINLV